jgi:tetratricopeptide (TPR) repeat protein
MSVVAEKTIRGSVIYSIPISNQSPPCVRLWPFASSSPVSLPSARLITSDNTFELQAVEYFNRAIQIDDKNGDIWSSLGHCFLMQDELQNAYNAYQSALFHLHSPKEDAKLWYGIGILYDRYGSLQHAEEAFSSVLKMDQSESQLCHSRPSIA